MKSCYFVTWVIIVTSLDGSNQEIDGSFLVGHKNHRQVTPNMTCAKYEPTPSIVPEILYSVMHILDLSILTYGNLPVYMQVVLNLAVLLAAVCFGMWVQIQFRSGGEPQWVQQQAAQIQWGALSERLRKDLPDLATLPELPKFPDFRDQWRGATLGTPNFCQDPDLIWKFMYKNSWREFSTSDAYCELSKLLTEELNKNSNRKKVLKFPTDPELCLFARLAYLDWAELSTDDDYLALCSKGWKLIAVCTNNSKLIDYHSLIFWNNETQNIILCHRGTDIQKPGSLIADLWNVVCNNFGSQINSACTVANVIKSCVLEVSDKIQINITGHSLGGWLAQISTLTAKHFHIDENSKFILETDWSKINNIHPHTVVFESPGCYEMLQTIQELYDFSYNTKLIDQNHLDITNYLNSPNVINTSGKHVGRVLAFMTREEIKLGTLSYIENHGIDLIKQLILQSKINKDIHKTVFFDISQVKIMTGVVNLNTKCYGEKLLCVVEDWPTVRYSNFIQNTVTNFLGGIYMCPYEVANCRLKVVPVERNKVRFHSFSREELLTLLQLVCRAGVPVCHAGVLGGGEMGELLSTTEICPREGVLILSELAAVEQFVPEFRHYFKSKPGIVQHVRDLGYLP